MSLDYERRNAVKQAWARERSLVKAGKGTRNWSKSEQRQLLETGRVKGYYGHHKCTVKNNPSQAGNPDNIQFLTRNEHYKAHNGNYKNDPHGHYNPSTGKVSKYTDSVKPEPQVKLDNRLKADEINCADKRYAKLQADKRSKAEARAQQKRQQTNPKERIGAKGTKKEGSGLKAKRSGTKQSNTPTRSKALQTQRSTSKHTAPTISAQSRTLQQQRSAKSVRTSAGTQSKTLSGQRTGAAKSSGNGKSVSSGGNSVSSGKGNKY